MSWCFPWICCGLAGPRIEPYRSVADVLPTVSPERHDESFLAALDPQLRTMYTQRLQLDMRIDPKYDPIVLNGASTHHVQGTVFGEFELGEIWLKNSQSVIFQVEDSDTIIQYSHNCGIRDFLHPLVMGAWLGTKAARAGIGPRIIFLSSPRKMTADDFLQYQFHMTREGARQCAGSSLRYLVMSKPSGTSFADRNQPGLRYTISIGRKIFLLLKIMHAQGFAHGALSEENIMVDESGNVQLFDFGDLSRRDIAILSPWEIKNGTYSFRDDVFRTIRVIASMLNGVREYKEYENRVFNRESVAGLLKWKMDKNFFLIPGKIDPVIQAIGEENRPLIREVTRSFLFLLSLIQRMDYDPTDIPYDEIVDVLEHVERKLNADSVVEERGPSLTY